MHATKNNLKEINRVLICKVLSQSDPLTNQENKIVAAYILQLLCKSETDMLDDEFCVAD